MFDTASFRYDNPMSFRCAHHSVGNARLHLSPVLMLGNKIKAKLEKKSKDRNLHVKTIIIISFKFIKRSSSI